MSFTSIFLIGFGMLSFVIGLLNKGGAFWMSVHRTSPKYNRPTNIILGIISIAVGIYLYKN